MQRTAASNTAKTYKTTRIPREKLITIRNQEPASNPNQKPASSAPSSSSSEVNQQSSSMQRSGSDLLLMFPRETTDTKQGDQSNSAASSSSQLASQSASTSNQESAEKKLLTVSSDALNALSKLVPKKETERELDLTKIKNIKPSWIKGEGNG